MTELPAVRATGPGTTTPTFKPFGGPTRPIRPGSSGWRGGSRVARMRPARRSSRSWSKDLGSDHVGVAFSMRLIWDASNNRFLAGANANANVALPYTVSDALPAVQPSAGIEIRNSTANCVAGATEADLEGGVGPVRRQGRPCRAAADTADRPTAADPPPFPPTTPTPPTPPAPPAPPTPPAPPADNSPFTFPPQPPYNQVDASARYTSLGSDPAARRELLCSAG